ncbi:hypothetical protein V2H45_20005 [Tumidithrix elongata RA019]|uniref:Uncharacterized protein n=1 Tax=Tumidithrix elongata BACA0141 TaxID=2716417 RepID=A0AAW9PVD9_9CYAN|nr:hypothetical protein [Tumidithrix elongata RA019]
MNAAEQAKSVALASKIASLVALAKSKYPAAGINLKPWTNTPDTRKFLDPDSIDLSFHFPGVSRLLKIRSILFQIRLHEDPLEGDCRAIGIEATGHDFQGQRWRFSTVERWGFIGDTQPMPEGAEDLKDFCRTVLEIFNSGKLC